MNSKDEVIKQLSSIWGISVDSATDMYKNKGIKSIEDLRQAQDSLHLSKNTKLYLEYYDDLSQRIPRKEITDHINTIQYWWKDYSEYRRDKSADLVMEAVGSYRRGEPTSGDIDIVVHIRNAKDRLLLVNPIGFFHYRLSQKGYLLHVFQQSENTIKGLVRLSHEMPVRRLDIFFAYGNEYPFYLLAKTGDIMFTKTMRHKVKYAYQSHLKPHETMILSEHGFRIKDKDGNYRMYRENLKFQDEHAIFRFIGVVPPLRPTEYKGAFPYEVKIMDEYRPPVVQKRPFIDPSASWPTSMSPPLSTRSSSPMSPPLSTRSSSPKSHSSTKKRKYTIVSWSSPSDSDSSNASRQKKRRKTREKKGGKKRDKKGKKRKTYKKTNINIF